MYADDLFLLSPSVNEWNAGYACYLSCIRYDTEWWGVYGGLHDIVFYAAKTVIMSVGRNIVHKQSDYNHRAYSMAVVNFLCCFHISCILHIVANKGYYRQL